MLVFVVVSCSAQCYFEKLQVGVLPLQGKLNQPQGTVTKTSYLAEGMQGWDVIEKANNVCVCVQVVLILKDRLMSWALSGSQQTVSTVSARSLALAVVTSMLNLLI